MYIFMSEATVSCRLLLAEIQNYFETISNSCNKKALKTVEICKLLNLFL